METLLNKFFFLLLALFSSPPLLAKTLVYCTSGNPISFTPAMITDGSSLVADSQLYNRLLDFTPGTTTLIPSLAESWEISKDGLHYTFELRKNVSFHSGFGFKPTRSFNTDDVLFSFHRQSDPSHPYHKVGGGHFHYFNNMGMGKIIKEIKKISPTKIEFVLHRKEAPFLSDLAMDFTSIHSAEYAQFLMDSKKSEKFDLEPIGTGPFAFESYQKDSVIKYKGFENYWDGKPKIDRLIFAITIEPSLRLQKLLANECQLSPQIDQADVDKVRNNSKLKLFEIEALNVGYVALNTQKKPFDNVLVRRALVHAMNRPSYINAIYMGLATLPKNLIPPPMWSHNDSIEAHSYDPDPATYAQKVRAGEHTMAQLGWTGDNDDPDNFFNVLLSCDSVATGGNRARWCFKPFDDLIQNAKAETNQKKRTEYYKEAQKIFSEQVPLILFAHGRVFSATRENVIGYKLSPLGKEDFSKVDLK